MSGGGLRSVVRRCLNSEEYEMNNSPAELLIEFHNRFASPTDYIQLLELRCHLLQEETYEFVIAALSGNRVQMADALADIAYVIYGTAEVLQIPLDECIREVHRSNMTKEPGPTGKAIKGSGYSPPNLERIVK